MSRRRGEPSALERAADVQNAIDNVRFCVEGMESADDLANDRIRQWATERQLANLLEAVWRLPGAIQHDYGGVERKAVLPPDVRNDMQQVANDMRHQYHRVTSRSVWKSVTERVPVIERYVAETVERLPREPPPRPAPKEAD